MNWGKDMFEELKNTTVLVTGATGLIGQNLVKKLLLLDARVVAVIRDKAKADKLFGNDERITYIIKDIVNLQPEKMEVDYIIHGASNTASKAFISEPVHVINIALEGTKRTLEIARLSNVKGYIFLSSMEVYGTPSTDEKIDEMHNTNLYTMSPRSSYPESKRMCESLCAAYASQYAVPTKVIRLTQTFGPGVQYHDNRVFAEFARCVIEQRDIVLHTKGSTKRSYLYTEDAVDAVLTVLLKGKVCEAYNAANEETYCSILQMAKLVAEECAEGKINVIVEEKDISSFGYSPNLCMNLDTGKIKNLGWGPSVDLVNMYHNMIADMKSRNSK